MRAYGVVFFSASYTLLLGSFRSNISDPILIFSIQFIFRWRTALYWWWYMCVVCGPCIVHVYVIKSVTSASFFHGNGYCHHKWTETIDRRALILLIWLDSCCSRNRKYYSSNIFFSLHSFLPLVCFYFFLHIIILQCWTQVFRNVLSQVKHWNVYIRRNFERKNEIIQNSVWDNFCFCCRIEIQIPPVIIIVIEVQCESNSIIFFDQVEQKKSKQKLESTWKITTNPNQWKFMCVCVCVSVCSKVKN